MDASSDHAPGFPPINGRVSHWYSEIGLPSYRPGLPGDRDVDVCIVGGGLTGLWTAYYLKQAQPDLRVAILEKEFAGFGASGRNGGWLSAGLAGSRTAYAKTHGRDGVLALLQAMRDAVDEVMNVAAREGIDADMVKDGLVSVARNQAQLARLHSSIEDNRSWGLTEEDLHYLEPGEVGQRIHVAGALGGSFTPPLRTCTARQARSRPRNDRRVPGCADLRTNPRHPDSAGTGDDAARHG